MRPSRIWITLAAGILTATTLAAGEPEASMYGNTPSRNMVLDAEGLPSEWDVKSGKNIKWSQHLGSQAYAGPVIHDGKVFVGTNNEGLRNPELEGDRGVVMAFDLATGEFLWQSTWPKLPAGRVNDWPLQGVCSTPAVQGERLWYVSNRGEVVCADTEGFRDGQNDGPYTEEHETIKKGDKVDTVPKTGKTDEDVVWTFDMIGELDVFPHNLAAGSPLIVGDVLYTVTGNGVDEGHINIPASLAPSLIALDKNTGELLWEDASPDNEILHGSWSNPTYAELDGKPQIVYPGGDGWLYSHDPKTGKLLWKFNLNPEGSVWELGGSGTKNNVISTPVVYEGLIYVGVGQDPEHGEGPGNLWAIDAAGKGGDITKTAVVWHRGGDDFHRTMSTAAIQDGLMYIADLSGFVYCLDAKTGEEIWKYDAFAAIWGSTLVADGKVYIGDEDGDIAVLKEGRAMELLGETNMGAAVYTTPVAHDGVLYVVSRNRLWAIAEGASPEPQEPKTPEKAEKEEAKS
jgi:outer membrane protein assembly factor BamB